MSGTQELMVRDAVVFDLRGYRAVGRITRKIPHGEWYAVKVGGIEVHKRAAELRRLSEVLEVTPE